MHCPIGGEWTSAHNEVRDILHFWSTRALLTVEKEKPGLLSSGCRPADLYLYHFLNGEDMAADITIVSPFKSSTMREAATEWLYAAKEASDRKYKKYAQDIAERTFKFQPVAFERTGGFSVPAQNFIKSVANAVQGNQHTPAAITQITISRQISVAIGRSTAQMALRRQTKLTAPY